MKKGFTIIELVIAIFILSIAIVGIFSAFSVMTILTSDSSDRLIAAYLAQEGMEIVRNIRDNNWLNMDEGVSGATWVDGLASIDTCSSTQGYEADYTSTGLSSTSGNRLCINTNGLYYQTASCQDSLKTKFERKIIIDCAKDPNGNPLNHIIKVTVQVSFDEKANILNSAASADNCGAYNCITTEETLYNWYNYSQQ